MEGKKMVQDIFPLGKYSTVFQAEVYAILAVAMQARNSNITDMEIYIFSDSQ